MKAADDAFIDGAVCRPDHVPADRVMDFDIYAPLLPGTDLHMFWRDLVRDAPHSLMWTPRNGGHWIALDGEMCDIVMSESDRFSNSTVLVPKETAGKAYRLIPLSLDPPEHRPFRNLLNDKLSPKAIKGLEEEITALTAQLIEGFKSKGQCDFIREFAEQLPVQIFMRVVDLPLPDLPKLKHLADQFTRPDGSMTYPEVITAFRDYIQPVIAARRGAGGADMISRMVSSQIEGRDLTDYEAQNICIQVLVGGLDTVVNMMGFVMSHLGQDQELRRAIAADPTVIEPALLECLRRFPVVSSSREVRHDTIFEGVELKAGDMVMSSTIPVSVDEALNEDSLAFSLRRTGRRHSTFGRGSHTCPGAPLARLELKILLREWFARIPEFKLKPGSTVEFASGIVGTVKPFILQWDN